MANFGAFKAATLNPTSGNGLSGSSHTFQRTLSLIDLALFGLSSDRKLSPLFYQRGKLMNIENTPAIVAKDFFNTKVRTLVMETTSGCIV